jgi:hypothetical protein
MAIRGMSQKARGKPAGMGRCLCSQLRLDGLYPSKQCDPLLLGMVTAVETITRAQLAIEGEMSLYVAAQILALTGTSN